MADWMLLARLAVYVAAMFRVRYANLFPEQASRLSPVLRDYESQRSSSYDLSGGNRDYPRGRR
jgi:hypothetical protein